MVPAVDHDVEELGALGRDGLGDGGPCAVGDALDELPGGHGEGVGEGLEVGAEEVDDHAEGVDVGGLVVLGGVEDLGRHVRGGADAARHGVARARVWRVWCAGVGRAAQCHALGAADSDKVAHGAKVRDLRDGRRPGLQRHNQDVLRLEVAVNDVRLVQKVHS